MTASAILTNLFTSREISDCLLNIQPVHNRDDIKQDTFLYLLEKAEAKPDEIIDLHKRDKLRHYVTKMLFNAANFSQSRINRQMRRETEIPTEAHCFPCLPEDTDEINTEERIQECLIKVRRMRESDKRVSKDWYFAELLEEYVQEGTFRKVAAKTGIPLNSVHFAVRIAKDEIKKSIL